MHPASGAALRDRRALGALRDAGVGVHDAHDALLLDSRTIREGETHGRPSRDRGLRLLATEPGTCREDDPSERRLPRVTAGEPVDANARLSHLVTTPDQLADPEYGRDEDGDPIAPPVGGRFVSGDDDIERAAAYLRERWEAAAHQAAARLRAATASGVCESRAGLVQSRARDT